MTAVGASSSIERRALRPTAGAGLCVLLAVACGASLGGAPSPAAAPAELACATDDDCVVSTFDTCCACPQCPGEPHALSREGARFERAAAGCASVDCTREEAWCAVAGMCPTFGAVARAACREGRCALATDAAD